MLKKDRIIAAIGGAAFVAIAALGIVRGVAQVPGQPPYGPAQSLPQSFASSVTVPGVGSSCLGPCSNGAFRVHGTTAAATSLVVSFAGGGYPGNASAYIPACVVNGETVAPTTVVPSVTGVTINFASTANAVFDVHCN